MKGLTWFPFLNVCSISSQYYLPARYITWPDYKFFSVLKSPLSWGLTTWQMLNCDKDMDGALLINYLETPIGNVLFPSNQWSTIFRHFKHSHSNPMLRGLWLQDWTDEFKHNLGVNGLLWKCMKMASQLKLLSLTAVKRNIRLQEKRTRTY